MSSSTCSNAMFRASRIPLIRRRFALGWYGIAAAQLLLLTFGGCPLATTPGNISTDTTLSSLTIKSGETMTVDNGAKLTVTGDVAIDGTLTATGGPLLLRVHGSLNLNGTLNSVKSGIPEPDAAALFDQQPVGIYIVVDQGAVTIGANTALTTNGSIVITDDESVLAMSPQDLFDDVENVKGESLPTLVPLPPENEALTTKPIQKSIWIQTAQAALPPVTVSGTWPPAGAPAPAGDRPVIVFRFNGPRDVNLDNWTVNGPAAPAGTGADNSGNAGHDATGGNGKDGMRLNIRNNGGKISIHNQVVLNLTDGGPGGDATAVCASATGGQGGVPGNLRMTAANGIDLTGGTLVINPGTGGKGGDATVTKGDPAAGGCPGGTGASSTAKGGAGGRNQKALFVQGNVTGIENVSFGPVRGGAGGDATATACDGGPGDACCDGGPGGNATATGGKGGDASLNLRGLAATNNGVFGGDGGNATATGGDGGKGGDCKFGDAGDGGAGGDATATGGAGGNASNSNGAATGGNGGAATANGGTGGDGGNSGFGTPGSGGVGGSPDATGGAAGTGTTPGTAGQTQNNVGADGKPGGQMPITLYCFGFEFIPSIPNVIPPGVLTGPVFPPDSTTQEGTLSCEFRDLAGAQYFRGMNPDHVGIQNGQLDFLVSTLKLETGTPRTIGGLRIAPLFATGIDANHPLTVEALDASGQVIGTQTFETLPNNQANPLSPETVDARFPVTESVATLRVSVPDTVFVTIIYVWLLDP